MADTDASETHDWGDSTSGENAEELQRIADQMRWMRENNPHTLDAPAATLEAAYVLAAAVERHGNTVRRSSK